jgi:hypothetical protein
MAGEWHFTRLTFPDDRRPPMLGIALILALCSLFWGVVGFVLGWLAAS